MRKPRSLTTSEELMIRMHYRKRSLQWIGERLGCSAPLVSKYAKQLGLDKPPARGNTGGEARVPVLTTAPNTAVPSRSIPSHSIPLPTREQLMAGSANLRRVYKVKD